jgi:hypothetical protein
VEKPFLSRALREPTVQFSLAAAVLFGVAALVGSRNERIIEISRADLDWLVMQAEMAQGGALDAELRQQVEDAYIDQQVLVREALAMGLDDDERIDDILAQKMLHVLSGEVIQPTDAELEAYYQANAARYALEATLSVDEVVVPPGAPDPMALPQELAAGLAPEVLVGGALLAHRPMASVTTADLAQLFSPSLAAQAATAELGAWLGPHVTVRGQHWIRVNTREEATPLPLEAVRDQVRLEWVAEQEALRLAERLAELRAGYTVRIVEGSAEP